MELMDGWMVKFQCSEWGGKAHRMSGMTPLVRVTMPETEMSLSMSLGFKSLMALMSDRLYGFVCIANSFLQS